MVASDHPGSSASAWPVLVAGVLTLAAALLLYIGVAIAASYLQSGNHVSTAVELAVAYLVLATGVPALAAFRAVGQGSALPLVVRRAAVASLAFNALLLPIGIGSLAM